MQKNSSSGIGLSGVLFVVFLVLKLTHVIDWAWLWVLSPLWIPLAIAVVIIILYAAGLYINRPKTPAEKAAAACRRITDAIRANRK